MPGGWWQCSRALRQELGTALSPRQESSGQLPPSPLLQGTTCSPTPCVRQEGRAMAGTAAARPALVRGELFCPLPRRTAPSRGHWPDSHATSQMPSPGGLPPGPGSRLEAPGPPAPSEPGQGSQLLPKHLFIALLSEQRGSWAPGWAPPCPPRGACPCASPSRWGWAGGPHSAGRGAPARRPVGLCVAEK